MTKYKMENRMSIDALISGFEIKNPLLLNKSKMTSIRLKKCAIFSTSTEIQKKKLINSLLFHAEEIGISIAEVFSISILKIFFRMVVITRLIFLRIIAMAQ